jgi:hypothetical protein
MSKRVEVFHPTAISGKGDESLDTSAETISGDVPSKIIWEKEEEISPIFAV